ncbi:MAG: hypothetical protein F6K40_12235 [Okeania sp. SIO3I5]|uniref:hypothetical protein n=1 Tax=Okeania sp. SIO3I5 TaxID=2607805 RepID=UPI0013B5F44E|nr:hypothetical protein [Okeania sp. SIO3I5]NEQ36998.1 hypothetical protein [Okeania sp. SIO3I5]
MTANEIGKLPSPNIVAVVTGVTKTSQEYIITATPRAFKTNKPSDRHYHSTELGQVPNPQST